MTEQEQQADAIVERLFVNGFGEKAERLVLVQGSGRWQTDLGGLCRNAVRDRVLEVLRKAGK